jgi:diguanylate cyclase (GGDEF)-like protein
VPSRESRSLRSLLWFGLLLCLLLGIGSFVVVIHRVVALTDARAAIRTRQTDALDAHHRRLIAVFENNRDRETEATLDLQRALPEPVPPRLATLLERLDDTIEDSRRTGDASAVRPAHDVLTAAFIEQSRHTVDRFEQKIELTVAAGVLLIGLGSVFAIAMVVLILRRTATPLERLAKIATDNAPFPQPEGTMGVREVDTLAWALHELDLAVRDREERLAVAHQEAVDLGHFGEHVQELVDEGELQDVMMARLTGVSDAHHGHLLVRDGTSERLEVVRSSTVPPGRLQLPILAEPLKCRAVRTLRPVVADAGSPRACRCPLVPEGGSYLCEPLLAAGELVGVVNLQASWKAHFTDRIQQRVHASIGFGATAMASLRLLASTRERALRDPLTGAYNRAFLVEYLNKNLALAERRDAGLGVLAIDLDHFKRLNDTHGHAAGDRALIATVEAIQREVRSADAVVRHGGEEIVVVLIDTDLSGALDAAERVRGAIAEIKLDSDRGQVAIRASIGVAAFPDHGRDQQSLLDAADRALYRAKDAGRNRVISADEADVAAAEAAARAQEIAN